MLAAGSIKDVSVDAVFTHTGNVRITEVWTVDVPDNWTEMYTVKGELRDMDIQDLEVRDRTTKTQFEYTGDDWDYERSREYKAGKCGTFVDEDDAVELPSGLLDPVHQHSLVVGLADLHLRADGRGMLPYQVT